ALARSFLDVQIAEIESLHFQRANPSLAIGEAAFGIISLITRPFAPATERADALVGRLDALPAFLDGALCSIAAGVPSEWRTKAMKECEGVERLLGDGLRRWLSLESLDDRRLRPAAERAGAGDGRGPGAVRRRAGLARSAHRARTLVRHGPAHAGGSGARCAGQCAGGA